MHTVVFMMETENLFLCSYLFPLLNWWDTRYTFSTLQTTKLKVARYSLNPVGNFPLGRMKQAHKAALITRSS